MGVRARHQDVLNRAADLLDDLLRQFAVGVLGEHAEVSTQEDRPGALIVQHDRSGIDVIVDGIVPRGKRVLRRCDIHFGGADKQLAWIRLGHTWSPCFTPATVG